MCNRLLTPLTSKRSSTNYPRPVITATKLSSLAISQRSPVQVQSAWQLLGSAPPDMRVKTTVRRPPIIIPRPNPSTTSPATFIFVYGYNDFASSFNRHPPNHQSIAHHIHSSPSLQHVKIVIPEGLPCSHPNIPGYVWYNISKPLPSPSPPSEAEKIIITGSPDNNINDMNVTLDYFEDLIEQEVRDGTPRHRIVFFGFSQGGSIVTLFLQTRRIAAELPAVISFSGFPATALQTIVRMQKEQGLVERWSKNTKMFLLHGAQDAFVSDRLYRAWKKQLEGFAAKGQGIASIEGRVVEGVRHSIRDTVWIPTREILELVVPYEEQRPLKL